MSVAEFEQIVAKDKYLNLLINEHKFGVMANIKKTSQMTDEFIDWISPKYYDAFKAIYDKCIADKKGVVSTVLRMIFLANSETKEMIGEFLCPKLDESIAEAHKLEKHVRQKKFKPEPAIEYLGRIFSPFNKGIFKHLEKTPAIDAKKKELTDFMLGISDQMKDLKANRDAEQFIVYSMIVTNLEEFKPQGEQQNRLVQHEQNETNKNVWAIIVTIVIFLILMSRFLFR
ncbi:MAG: hypothetical protein GQ574_01230 [Crocinitomix sp.]|nr:hypothetical protein [Crocinitomix sp.]